MRRAQHRVVEALAGQVQLLRTPQRSAAREVHRLALEVDGRHRGEEAVLRREVDEAGVGVADRQHLGGALDLAVVAMAVAVASIQTVQPAQEGRVGRSDLLPEAVGGGETT